MIQFGYKWLCRGRCYSVISKILMIVLSRILLHGIAQNFACNKHTLRDTIDIIFGNTAC